MAVHGGTVWPVVGVVVLIYAAVNSSATPDLQEILTNHANILKGLSLNYEEESQHRDVRESSDCNATESRTVNCNLECQCVEGKWQCCRLRKGINMMTEAEVKRFTDAYVKVVNDPRFSTAFTSLSWSHAILACGKHPSELKDLGSWHNMMIFALENLLRLVDCGVTVPYWDATMKADSALSSVIPDGFSTVGLAKDNYCLTDGPFKKGAFKIPKLTYNGKAVPYSDCLQRAGGKNPAFPYQLFQTMLTVKPDLVYLLDTTMYELLDQDIHDAMGGSFMGLVVGVDPLLYLLHNYGNKIIANFQIQGPNHFTGGGSWEIDTPMEAFPWFKSKDFVDPFNLPNGVCVRYAASMPREKAIRMGYYAGLEIPRKDHLSLPYMDARELPIDVIEAHTVSLFIEHMKAKFPSFTLNEDGPWFNRTAQTAKIQKEKSTDTMSISQCIAVEKIYHGFGNFNVSGSLAQLL